MLKSGELCCREAKCVEQCESEVLVCSKLNIRDKSVTCRFLGVDVWRSGKHARLLST
jgi:hypothetical protein